MGVDGTEWHTLLCADLRQIRLHGVSKARTVSPRHLLDAAEVLGHRVLDLPIDLAVEALLHQAIGCLGESPEANAAALTFGLRPGMKMTKAADRRKAAARAQGVSVETFRKSYEPALIEQLATEIAGMLSRRDGGERPASSPRTAEHVVAPVRTFAHERHVPDILRVAHANADWDLVEGVYRQCIAVAEDKNGHFMPDELPSSLAKAFGRISANYHRREEDLVLHGLAILGNAEHADRVSPALFSGLYRDVRFDRYDPYRPAPPGHDIRRRPHPFETLVETARRYRDLNHLSAVLADLPTSCILGGSLNYGRYFSVRGAVAGSTGSNVDILVVIPDFGWMDEVLSGISTLPGCGRASLTTLERRARLWRENGLDDGRTVFTQRLSVWSDTPDPLMEWAPDPGEYELDLRIASIEALDWLLVADAPKLTAGGAGHHRSVRDFCQSERSADGYLRSFSGRSLRMPLDVEKVDDSLLLTHRVYSIHEDRYYPGSLQNLILPRFNKRWDNAPIGGKLETFRWKIVERLRAERRDQPYEVLRVSLAHTRADGFAPHILSSIDSVDTL